MVATSSPLALQYASATACDDSPAYMAMGGRGSASGLGLSSDTARLTSGSSEAAVAAACCCCCCCCCCWGEGLLEMRAATSSIRIGTVLASSPFCATKASTAARSTSPSYRRRGNTAPLTSTGISYSGCALAFSSSCSSCLSCSCCCCSCCARFASAARSDSWEVRMRSATASSIFCASASVSLCSTAKALTRSPRTSPRYSLR
mmetsp:Transcript_18186/g.29053  ORF Transcript_18186/g.29053 Transcript_18186/m.29053 type:complete len:204 (+) Transcript_18186:525-1136(+)